MSAQREAQRQQMLLRALWRDAGSAVVQGWLADRHAGRGLVAYRSNVGALAERALAAAFPTVMQLVGDESFGALARDFWQHRAPQRGDLAWFGERLPAFIAGNEQLAGEPYLADCARLDWAVHRAESAADAPTAVAGLDRLAGDDPSRLALRLVPGSALIESPHPVATIRQAHRSDAPDRFAAVRAAFAAGRAEQAFVWRAGWKAQVAALSPSDAAFTRGVLAGASLAQALQDAGAPFEFQPWLLRALREGWIAAVESIEGL